jgi:uncharacterized protein (TIGR03437 family)
MRSLFSNAPLLSVAGVALLGPALFAPALFGQTSSPPAITSVSNAASGAKGVESGSWVSIYGSGLATTTRSWQASDFSGHNLPTTIDGVTVLIDGKKAAIAYVSPTQLNVQAPADTASGSVPVQVTSALGTASGTTTLQSYAPGLFSQGKYAAARHSDGTMIAPAGYFGSSATSRPAVPGENVELFATGLGPTTPAVTPGQTVPAPEPVSNLTLLSVTIGGVAAKVSYAGIVAPGEYQMNVVVPALQDGDQPITVSINGVSAQSGVLFSVLNSVTGTVSVSLTPPTSTIRLGATATFTAKVGNTTNQGVQWQVNGISGGNATVGTIAAGVYTSPSMLPSNPAVTITAVSMEAATATGSATINLENALPLVSAATPTTINPGPATISVAGSGFATNAVIYVAGVAMPTTFVSTQLLTATGTVAMPAGRMASVKVTNPNPGGATSAPVVVLVRPAVENMAYADAVRFLDMTTFGGTPQDVVNLQTLGLDAWLAAQFAQPASAWPDPNSAAENVTRLQTAFFDIAMNGSDQLRQRVSFALAEIMVSSAVKDTLFEQMVPYQRQLGDDAFGSFRNLMTDMTLNPSMGFFLDMVNNVKANAAADTAPNENYAREMMQLFTVGLKELNIDGTPYLLAGQNVAEYTEADVGQMAKVMTGWTYGETPGFASNWNNSPYYFGPMVAFDAYHDMTAKTIGLPIPCNIVAGGTSVNDLKAALDCVYSQQNVAPFISYELIQRLVLSSPSPAYVSRIAQVFTSSSGNLQTVVTAILTDPEAATPGTGKLAEPVLYTTNLLRALNAADTSSGALPAQANAMGQNVLTPSSVFSYFSPAYRIPSVGVVAPEFQAVNASTALARANYAYAAVSNGLSSSIVVNLTNLTDIASNPANLVEAVNQAFFRGEIDPNVQTVLLTAANASTNPSSRVRSVLYAAASSPQFQVKQ